MQPPIVLLGWPSTGESAHVVAPDCPHVVGRSNCCDLVVNHTSVSRRHAVLTVDGVGLWVTDLASKNGTFVGEKRVTGTTAVPLGNRVRFGSTVFFVAGQGRGGEEPGSAFSTGEPTPRHLPGARVPDVEQLSSAQRRVFDLLLTGLCEKLVASRLGISRCTAHNHICAIYRTFGVHSRAELLVLAHQGAAAPRPARRDADRRSRTPQPFTGPQPARAILHAAESRTGTPRHAAAVGEA
jgi:DNA-binding CsgD family transcriptional regulator